MQNRPALELTLLFIFTLRPKPESRKSFGIVAPSATYSKQGQNRAALKLPLCVYVQIAAQARKKQILRDCDAGFARQRPCEGA